MGEWAIASNKLCGLSRAEGVSVAVCTWRYLRKERRIAILAFLGRVMGKWGTEQECGRGVKRANGGGVSKRQP